MAENLLGDYLQHSKTKFVLQIQSYNLNLIFESKLKRVIEKLCIRFVFVAYFPGDELTNDVLKSYADLLR